MNTFTSKVQTFTEDDKTKIITAKFGMNKIGDQTPYFSMTGDIVYKRGQSEVQECGGMIHDEIAKHLPELKPLFKWHLVDQDGVPMHYVANGKYWFEKIGKPKENSYDPDALDAFKSTVIFGATEGEAMPISDNIDQWLTERMPEVAKAFFSDMEKFGVKLIKE